MPQRMAIKSANAMIRNRLNRSGAREKLWHRDSPVRETPGLLSLLPLLIRGCLAPTFFSKSASVQNFRIFDNWRNSVTTIRCFADRADKAIGERNARTFRGNCPARPSLGDPGSDNPPNYIQLSQDMSSVILRPPRYRGEFNPLPEAGPGARLVRLRRKDTLGASLARPRPTLFLAKLLRNFVSR